jgi:hypothetical protein
LRSDIAALFTEIVGRVGLEPTTQGIMRSKAPDLLAHVAWIDEADVTLNALPGPAAEEPTDER